VYLFDSYYSFRQEKGEETSEYSAWVREQGINLNIPLVGLAIGFPPITRNQDPSGVYVKGDYNLQEMSELEDDDCNDFEQGGSALPDDVNSQ